MNSTTQRKIDECIAEMSKKLIWLENTCKKKNPEWERVGARNKKEKWEEEGAASSQIKSVFCLPSLIQKLRTLKEAEI
jgi:hypothetical protein